MCSDLPKVLHSAAGQPLLGWVLGVASEAGCDRRLAVIGHRAEEVVRAFADEDIEWVVQKDQLGTGHALAQAETVVAREDLLVVLSGDVPLVRATTLERLVEAARSGWGAMVVADLDPPGSLGRVLVDDEGHLARIVEASDATPEELAVSTINAGIYALPAGGIFDALRELSTENAQGEFYLTDAVTAQAAAGHRVALVHLEAPQEALGVNTRLELASVDEILMDRCRRRWMERGVTMVTPASIRIDPKVEIGEDCSLHPNVTLSGSTTLAAGVTVHQGGWLRDSRVGASSEILPYSVLEGAEVASNCRVGPFARLRPGAELGEGSKVGNFVEVKNSRLGAGAKASHLTYLGDAVVGDGANIGAGVVTCNYDGTAKHRTEIGPGAFVGSDTMLVAPVRVGAEATTGAGSVITKDVPDRALAVGRARQRNIADWVGRLRPELPSHKASDESAEEK
jgi:bifunctional UDP-N-acetylglucosamine pyrophosphorylase/glucosamine-1-phosphate N-acetyltransferase